MTTPLRIRLPAISESEFIERYRAHLSRGGIFIATHSPKPEGTELSFELVLRDGTRVLRGGAVVLKVRGEGQTAPPGMMLRFRKLDVPSKTLVERLAAERPSGAAPRFDGDLPTEVEVQLEFTGEAPAPNAAMELPVPAPAPRRRISLEVPAAEAPLPPPPSLGLEIGLEKTRVAQVRDGKPVLLPLGSPDATYVPSAVAVGDSGELLFGWEAAGAAQPWTGWTLGVGLSSAAPLAAALFGDGPYPMTTAPGPGGDVAWRLGERQVTAKELMIGLLAQVRALLEAELGTGTPPGVVCCVPSHFGHRQRAALQEAAEEAGFHVLRFLHGTSAAALAAVHGLSLPRKRVLVCELGGAGADAAVIQLTGNELETVATGSDPGHGVDPHALVHELLEESGLQPQALDELILTGEAASSAEVQSRWESQLGKAPLPSSHFDELPVRGAALLAHAATRPWSGLPFATAAEVLTRTLEVVVEGGTVQRVFERGTHLPAEKTLEVMCEADRPLSLAVFQTRHSSGHARQAGGTSSVPEPVGMATIQCEQRGRCILRLCLDGNGLLSLSATLPGSASPEPLPLDRDSPVPEGLLPGSVPEPQAGPPSKGGILGGIRRLWKRG